MAKIVPAAVNAGRILPALSLHATGECLRRLEVQRSGRADNKAQNAVHAHNGGCSGAGRRGGELLAHSERRNDEVDVLWIGWVCSRPQEQAECGRDCACARLSLMKAKEVVRWV